MKSLTVRLPDALLSEISREARRRNLSKSEVVRERLSRGRSASKESRATLESVTDLIGSVDGLPQDLSRRTKKISSRPGMAAAVLLQAASG